MDAAGRMHAEELPGAFARDFWQKKPVVLEGAAPGLGDEDALLQALSSIGSQVRLGSIKNIRDVSFLLGGARVVDPGRYLPTGQESSLAEYCANLSGMVASGPFTLLINEFQQFSLPIWKESRRFLLPLFRSLGQIPAGSVSTHLMVARYGVSPYGVHKDPNTVFTVLVRGEKAILAWPYDALSSHTRQPFAKHRQLDLHGFDYGPVRDSAMSISGKKGDVLYWPSTYWHVGEAGEGDVHVSLHLTCQMHTQTLVDMADIMRDLIADAAKSEDWAFEDTAVIDSSAGPVCGRPPRYDATIERLASLARGMDGMSSSLWLSRLSAQGFVTNPKLPPREEKIEAGDWLVPDEFPIFYALDGGTINLALHGRVLQIPFVEERVRLLDAVKAGKPFRLDELFADDGQGVREDACELATILAAYDALTVMRGEVPWELADKGAASVSFA